MMCGQAPDDSSTTDPKKRNVYHEFRFALVNLRGSAINKETHQSVCVMIGQHAARLLWL